MNFNLINESDDSSIIKVIGVGGGGSNAVRHMFDQGIIGVDFAICNTDSQALNNSGVPNKIQLGVNLEALLMSWKWKKKVVFARCLRGKWIDFLPRL